MKPASRGSRQWLHRTGGYSTVEVAFDCLSALYISRGTREEMDPQFLPKTYQKGECGWRGVPVTTTGLAHQQEDVVEPVGSYSSKAIRTAWDILIMMLSGLRLRGKSSACHMLGLLTGCKTLSELSTCAD
jgi:hypothetical protein